MVVNLSVAEAEALLDRGIQVVDVRDNVEWLQGHLPGARSLPLAELRAAPAQAALSRDAVLFVCAGGMRSQTAARLARHHGVRRVYSLVGGTQAWARSGRPLSRPEPARAQGGEEGNFEQRMAV